MKNIFKKLSIVGILVVVVAICAGCHGYEDITKKDAKAVPTHGDRQIAITATVKLDNTAINGTEIVQHAGIWYADDEASYTALDGAPSDRSENSWINFEDCVKDNLKWIELADTDELTQAIRNVASSDESNTDESNTDESNTDESYSYVEFTVIVNLDELENIADGDTFYFRPFVMCVKEDSAKRSVLGTDASISEYVVNFSDYCTDAPVYCPAVEPTYEEDGHIEYYYCSHYDKYYSDEEGINEISADTIIVPKLEKTEHKVIEGADSTITKGSEFSIKVDGPFENFHNVEIDGKIIDSKYYSCKKGSTIITFNSDFMSIISAGQHDIKVNYTDGSYATTKLVVTAKTSDENGGNNNSSGNKDEVDVNSGENTVAIIMLIMLFVGSAGLAMACSRRAEEIK